MKLVYTHDNPMLVENAKNLLSQHGIESFVKNEYLSGGMGELSAITTWPELWVVADQDYKRAKAVISQLSETTEQEKWKCPSCNEINDPSFELCWNCQREKP